MEGFLNKYKLLNECLKANLVAIEHTNLGESMALQLLKILQERPEEKLRFHEACMANWTSLVELSQSELPDISLIRDLDLPVPQPVERWLEATSKERDLHHSGKSPTELRDIELDVVKTKLATVQDELGKTTRLLEVEKGRSHQKEAEVMALKADVVHARTELEKASRLLEAEKVKSGKLLKEEIEKAKLKVAMIRSPSLPKRTLQPRIEPRSNLSLLVYMRGSHFLLNWYLALS
ncbi:hypothetical protein Pelo_1492 [Pelomyxa schiedti]|nr:hypothetical protein Pelo_1492 [Pelomyxa schiedti]